jgi:hypothetical protein
LLNPSWIDNNQSTPKVNLKFTQIRGFISHIFNTFGILKNLFKTIFTNAILPDLDEDIMKLLPYDKPGRAVFCSIVSVGGGINFPYILLPRPRGVAIWSSVFSFTDVANIFTGKGFYAAGAQKGIVLGFMGLGFTFYNTGFRISYVLIGFALFTSVTSEHIEYIGHQKNVHNISDRKGIMVDYREDKI